MAKKRYYKVAAIENEDDCDAYLGEKADPFLTEFERLSGIFGEEYVTEHPVLLAAAVIESEIKALRLEIAQLSIAVSDSKVSL